MNAKTKFSANPKNPDFYNNPYPVYTKMRALGPCFLWQEYDMVCFSHHNEVNALLRDRRCGRDFSGVMSRSDVGLPEIPAHLKSFYEFESNSMLELEPPTHTRLRKLVNRAFVSRHIEGMRDSMATLANNLIDKFPSDHPVDLLPSYAEKIPVIIIARLLGVPEQNADQLLDWSHKMVAMYQFNKNRKTEDAAVNATEEFCSYIKAFVEQKRSNLQDDLISRLIEAEEDGSKLTSEELVTTCILLLNAGHEATVHAIGNSVKALLENISHQKNPWDEDALSIPAMDELLRFDSPLHMFTRYVLENFEISGTQLKKGQTIGLLLGAANHDEARYEKPARLDFSRGGAGHVAFGAGIHFCVGAPLARMEMQIALTTLFRRLPNLRLSETPTYSDRYHFHGLSKLMVTNEN